MNRKEIAEIRRRLNPEQNAISCVRGCYVNEKREIVSAFTHSLLTLPMEETEKYLSLFKRTLSGVPTRNLLELDFSADQVMEGAQHALLMALRNGALREEETVEAFYQAVIDSLEMEGNYLILLLHDTYDVPMRVRDRGEEMDEDAGDEVFSYILCAICPVKLAKPALSYFDQDNAFHSRDMDWVVSSPELGFLFPRFDDRAPNISGALYFTRDAANRHDEWISAVMGEVGLAGELRSVSHVERRLSECMRLGFDHAVIPRQNLRGARIPEGMHVHAMDTVTEALGEVFGWGKNGRR